MAVKIVNLGSGGTQEALLRQLMEQYGEQATPKVGGLQRILAPLTGIGSIIDAYYDARYQDKNANIFNVLKNYGLNVGQGLGTLLTGTNYEKDQRMQGASELLDKTSPGFKYSPIGKSVIGRMGIDILGGLLTDPTTYLSFGATTLADDVLKNGLLKAGLGKKTVGKLLPQLSGGTMDDVTKTLIGMGKIGKKTGAEVADNLYVYAVQNVGKGPLKSGALKAFGKTISESPKVVKGTKAIISPLGAGIDALSAGSKRFAPELRSSFLKTFDPVQGAIEAGHGDEAADLLKFNREASSVGMSTLSEIEGSGMRKTYRKMSEKEAKGVPSAIEAGRETLYKAGEAELLMKRKDEILDALKEQVGGDVKEIGEIFPESRFGSTTPLKLSGQMSLDDTLPDVMREIDRRNMAAGSKLDVIYESLNQDQKELLDPLIQEVAKLGDKKISKNQLSRLFDSTVGNYITKEGQPIFLKEGLTKNQQKFVSQYFDFERGITNKMKEAGLPTIDPREMGYLARNNPKGYKENAIKSILKRRGMGDAYEKVMGDKNVLKEMEKNGFVKRDTLQKVLNKNEWAAFKEYDPGMIGELISGGGATKERVFKTREQAEKAGIVYGDETLLDIYDQTTRQKEQLLAMDFAKNMVSDKTAFSKKPSGIMTTPITVPGVGQFYTDRYTAGLAQDYISKYTTVDGMDELLSGFDKIQRTWKRWVTGGGPNIIPYNIRNLIDDNIRLIVGGADVKKLPEDYELAIDMFKYEDLINKVGKKKALKQIDQSRAAKFLKSVGVEADNPIDELWQRSVKNGVYSDVSKFTTEMGIERPREVLAALGEKGKVTARQKLDEKITLSGKLQRREQATRMATYFNFWRKEGAENAGIDAVQRISFNYNELTKPEREVFKRVVPFYGFVKNNIKFYMDLLRNNPEKLARYYNVYQGLQTGSQSKFGEEWEAMPDYVKDTLSIPLSEENGELKYLSGINLGIEGLADIPIGRGGLARASENLSPALSMLIELTSGKDLFRNEDILEVNQGYNYENRSELLKKLMNYQKYPVELEGGKTYEKQTVSPVSRYILENLPFISTLNTGARRFSDFKGGNKRMEALTNSLFPGRINVGKVDDARSRIEKKQQEDLYKLLQRKGIADVYKSFYIPEGLREQLFNK